MSVSAPSRPIRVRSRHLPKDPDDSGWLLPLEPPPPARRLTGEEHYDCAVIGAGFTGLAAARRLAELEPGWRVAVIDALRAGQGASGRSSGFVVAHAGFIADMPDEHEERFIRLSQAGIEDLRRIVDEKEIDCDWDERGWLHVAAGEAGMAGLGNLRPWLEKRGVEHQWLDHGGMEGVTGTTFYRAGIRLPGSVLVDSGKLVRGLAATLPENVELFEESPVHAVGGGRPYRLTSDDGTLVVPRLIVALNGYMPGLGCLKRRVFPLVTYGSLTRRLSAAEQEILGGETEWGVLAQDPMGSSVRRTRDQRILIRNHLHYDRRCGHGGGRLRRQAEKYHRQALAVRYPRLEGLDFEYTWGGVMGASPNFFPFFGWLGENAATTAGFTAAGIASGTIGGRLAAEWIAGHESALLDDRLALPGPRWIPPEPFLSLGIRMRVARMNASAGETL